MNKTITCLWTLILSAVSLYSSETAHPWQMLEAGMELAVFTSPQKAESGNSKITVLRIDPRLYDVDIYCASASGNRKRTAREWADEFGLSAVINAGMYATDLSTAVGYLKSRDHLNNPRMNQVYNCVFACGPKSSAVPPVQIIDRKCQDFAQLKNKYRSFSQGIRMISCRGNNVWQQKPDKWSIAALAMDRAGNLLLIHCRSAYSVHDFINILLSLPLDIYNAMYLDGGPVASLFYRAGNATGELIGDYDTTLMPTNSNSLSWQIPNVIGVKKK